MQRMVNSPENTEQFLGLLHPDRHSMLWFTNVDSSGYLDNYEKIYCPSDVNKLLNMVVRTCSAYNAPDNLQNYKI